MVPRETEPILGFTVRHDSLGGCVGEVLGGLSAGQRCWLACFNPHSYVATLSRPAFRDALRSADWLVPDGVGVVLASRFLGGSIRQRVTGSDIFSAVNTALQDRGGGSVFFLGSTEDTLSAIRERMAHDWPDVQVVGTWSPPFKPVFSGEDNEEMARRINAAHPDVLWVGMTAPKQEEWIHAMLPRLEVRFAGAVGAVFDFYAGRVRRSHPFFQRLGLEWLPRLIREPRRLWRRTFVSAPIFFWHVLRARLSGGGARELES